VRYSSNWSTKLADEVVESRTLYLDVGPPVLQQYIDNVEAYLDGRRQRDVPQT